MKTTRLFAFTLLLMLGLVARHTAGTEGQLMTDQPTTIVTETPSPRPLADGISSWRNVRARKHRSVVVRTVTAIYAMVTRFVFTVSLVAILIVSEALETVKRILPFVIHAALMADAKFKL